MTFKYLIYSSPSKCFYIHEESLKRNQIIELKPYIFSFTPVFVDVIINLEWTSGNVTSSEYLLNYFYEKHTNNNPNEFQK